jgi:exodeoxyribonuclease V gamma subunit
MTFMGAAGESAERGLRVHTSCRLEDLLGSLVQSMTSEPLPPEVDEVVLVPSTGMARWLERQLATSELGICASVDMPFLAPWFRGLFDETPRRRMQDRLHALSPEVLHWRIHRLFGDPRHAAAFARPRRYFATDPQGTKQLQLAQRVAGCLDQYQLYRPDMLAAWESHGLLTKSEDEPWQAALWRALLAEGGTADPAPTLARVLERLREKSPPATLPRRVQAFGFSTVPPLVMELFEALSAHCQVDLYAFVPTPHYMDERSRRRRKTSEPVQHELLAELGMQSSDFVLGLADREGALTQRMDVDHSMPRSDSLLHKVQAGIEAMDEPRGNDPIRAGDDSLRVHVTHSPFREMEVLRDRVLDAMERDSSLKPNEVLVLVTDIESYAPAIHSVFGPVAHLLPYQVQDRTPATEKPLAKALVDVFRLAASRWTNVEVLDLLSNPCLQARFGLQESGAAEIRGWVREASVHWGIDGTHRASFGQPASHEHTWRQGLDRLVLGTMTGPVESLVDGLLPVARHGQEVAVRIGRLAWCLEELMAVHHEVQTPRSLGDWIGATRKLLGRVLDAPSADDREDRKLLLDVLATMARIRDLSSHEGTLSLQAWTDSLVAALGSRSSSRFGGDKVTFAALRPMRMVPARLLAVCGLGDVFPRSTQAQSFDLMQVERRRGDRDPRADDRQLFLEALMSARDKLLLSHVGRSQRSNEALTPSTVLTELLESVDRGWAPAAGAGNASATLVVEHLLQGFSRSHRADHPHHFSYARLEGAGTNPSDRFVPEGFAARDNTTLHACTVDDLVRFWRNPAQHFLRHAVGLGMPFREEQLEETENFGRASRRDETLGKLVEAMRVGTTGPEAALDRQGALHAASGSTQPGWLGRLAHQADAVDAEMAAARASSSLGTDSLLAVARLDDCTVTAWVRAARDRTQVIFAADRKEVPERMKLQAWILHLVCSVAAGAEGADPRTPVVTRLVMPSGAGRFAAVDAAQARQQLSHLVHGLRQGRSRPLPFFPITSAVLAKGDASSEAELLAKAEKEFLPDDYGSFPSESEDAHVKLCWRGQDLFAGALAAEMKAIAESVWCPALAAWQEEKE